MFWANDCVPAIVRYVPVLNEEANHYPLKIKPIKQTNYLIDSNNYCSGSLDSCTHFSLSLFFVTKRFQKRLDKKKLTPPAAAIKQFLSVWNIFYASQHPG